MLALWVERSVKAALVAPVVRCTEAEVLDVNFIGAVHRLNHVIAVRHQAFIL